MDTIKIERPANIPSDFKAVVCCTSCHEPVAFGLGFLERITPDTIRFADGTKPLLGTSVFRECPKCGTVNNFGGMGKWKLIDEA